MAVLDELVTQIENPDLRARIAAEVEKLAKQKKFGLVFEEHLPECTPLWDIPVKAGRKAALKTGHVNDFYTVLKIEDGVATCLNKDKSATAAFPVEELVCVAEFGEPIYPYLKPIDTVCNAPDSDLWQRYTCRICTGTKEISDSNLPVSFAMKPVPRSRQRRYS